MHDFGSEEAAAKAAAARAADIPPDATSAHQWSGLTNSQMGRLARSPLALGVAKVRVWICGIINVVWCVAPMALLPLVVEARSCDHKLCKS